MNVEVRDLGYVPCRAFSVISNIDRQGWKCRHISEYAPTDVDGQAARCQIPTPSPHTHISRKSPARTASFMLSIHNPPINKHTTTTQSHPPDSGSRPKSRSIALHAACYKCGQAAQYTESSSCIGHGPQNVQGRAGGMRAGMARVAYLCDSEQAGGLLAGGCGARTR